MNENALGQWDASRVFFLFAQQYYIAKWPWCDTHAAQTTEPREIDVKYTTKRVLHNTRKRAYVVRHGHGNDVSVGGGGMRSRVFDLGSNF